MTIVGGIIAASGAFVSYFAFGVWQFLFTFGVIVGVGLCLCFNTAIVAVTYYFQVGYHLCYCLKQIFSLVLVALYLPEQLQSSTI